MALRDQPYFPLYVQDYLTDEKLNLCSPSTQGVYIKIMCVFHKSEQYGGILLKQKDKQDENIITNFALKLSKLLPFQLEVITESLNELIDESVLLIDGDFLYQKRMVKDNDISIKRAKSGKKGGENSLGKDKSLLNQNDKQKPEYEDENRDIVISSFITETEDKKEPFPFSEFWNQYGKKVDNKKCESKWKTLSAKDKAAIMETVPLYVQSTPDVQYRKNPLTYLNGKCWTDEIIIRGPVKLPPPNFNPSYEKWDGQKRWSGSQEIPYNAPPKPSNVERWDNEKQKWTFSNF